MIKKKKRTISKLRIIHFRNSINLFVEKYVCVAGQSCFRNIQFDFKNIFPY